jgi:dihydrolipoamide dehydrogenase
MPIKVTIIGAGPGGYVAAARAAQLGAEVTVIEEGHVGGTCLNGGCIPSKVLIHTGELLERFHKAGQWGISLEGEARLDLQNLMARKRQVIEIQREGILKLFKHHRIRYLSGRGTIKGSNVTSVTTEDNETLEVPCDRLILATGSQPLALESLPYDHERILDSSDALSPNEIPESLLIVGGGVIGCEFAFVYSSLGSRVTVVEALSRILPLPSVDPDMSKVIQREMKKRKIAFLVDRVAEKIEPAEDQIRVTIGTFSPGSEQKAKTMEKAVTIDVDKVLVCVGRRPKTTHLGFEETGIKLDPRGWVQVNDQMETSVPHIYAIGDMLGPSRPMLAHMASAEGLIAAENAMGENRTISYDVVPGVVFTSPEVADVGMTEIQAMEAGYSVRSETVLFRNLGKAQIMGHIAGQAKIIWDEASGKVLGVHMVGPNASDLIAEGALAIRKGLTIKDLAETIHAHPTLAEVMAEVAHKALGTPIHG